VRDGVLNAGTNSLPFPGAMMSSAPDADGGTKRREGEVVSFDSTGGPASAVGYCLLCGALVKVCPPTFLQGPDV
jgi:hypothetical protein